MRGGGSHSPPLPIHRASREGGDYQSKISLSISLALFPIKTNKQVLSFCFSSIKKMTVVTATLFSILLSSVAFALPVTNTGNTTIVAQLPSPTKTCVTAGSHEQYCIDKEELHDFISIPVFQPYFDCFKQFSTCEVQGT